ncbi:hypothetical protein EYC98_11200 [Halieaceae bacterium IMCC14734]|uniref:Uncharacterized protein n=1 Tax=Candidatus Litorirhabdus singularis TaxID=2518993 RepID=A0ABT3TGN2_9GAMM|nr:CsiV family protein [Candidatus Litorirhabdus singularis]MCX2981429.1 hypothetical protein [Candidatus Litorirhabdus singularis]
MMLCMAWSSSSSAQHDTNWYQVELLVFNYLTPRTNEKWPIYPELGYPDYMQALEDITTDNNAARDMEFVTLETAAAEPIDLFWERSLESLWQEVGELERNAQVLAPTADSNSTATAVYKLSVPAAFSRLPASAQQFRDEVDLIRRSADLHLLYHESWLQPMRGRDRSIAMVLDSDEKRGAYPVLQGSILLHVSRYLHIETDLWVNIEASGQGRGRYLSPPPPPVQASSTAAWQFRIETSEMDFSMAPDEPLMAGSEVVSAQQLADALALPSSPWYDFAQPVQVTQRRRMRSSEVHFIDHPLVGIIVTVTPYEFLPFIDPQAASDATAAVADPTGVAKTVAASR